MLWAKTNTSLPFVQMAYINHAEGTLTPSQKSHFSLLSVGVVAFISIHMYTYTYICVYIYREMRGLTPERVDYVCLCVCIFAFIHTYTYMYVHIYRQIHTRIYICIHTNT